jgi:hypothetical protein
MEKFKAKNVLKLVLKYRDYGLALKMIEILGNLKGYQPLVYEDWCLTMLKHSTLREHQIKDELNSKFEQLARKLVTDQGGNPNGMDQAKLF